MKSSPIIKLLVAVALTIAIISCTKGGGGGDDSGGSTPPPSNGGGSGGDEPEARTNCGVVINNQIVNPVTDSNGIAVRIVDVAASNAFIVSTDSGNILVKLHGISSDPAELNSNAVNFLKRYKGYLVLFIRASDSCSAVIAGGGTAQVGQLITSSGESIAENLVRTGFANATSGDGCGSDLLSGCYTALHESDPITAGTLDAFLWKPEADSDGKLAIHTGPYNTTVTVNGEVGRNQGSGNGYGSLARFNKHGCGYPSPRISVLSNNGFPYTVGGQTTFTVPNPCGRNCLQNGSIVPCSK